MTVTVLHFTAKIIIINTILILKIKESDKNGNYKGYKNRRTFKN